MIYGYEPEWKRGGGVATPSPIPPAFERAFEGAVAMPAFNPTAGFIDVGPTSFRPGDNIDIDISYWARNPDAYWNTCIVVTRQDDGRVYCKTHGMISHDDDHIVEPLVCGKMPTTGSVILLVEIWGHDDYFSSPPTQCP